jgi:hypothetical protein
VEKITNVRFAVMGLNDLLKFPMATCFVPFAGAVPEQEDFIPILTKTI